MMKRIKTSLISLLTGVVLLECGNATAASFLIDDFSDAGQYVHQGGGAAVTFLEDPPSASSSIIGGYRDIFLTNVNGTSNTRRAAGSVDPPANATLTYSNDNSVYSRLEVTWDGLDGSSNVATTGLSGKDLTLNGVLDGISISYLSADQSLNTVIKIWDMSGNQSQASFTFPSILTNQTVNFVYKQSAYNLLSGNKALFSPVTSQGANFANVGAIQLLLQGSPTTLTALDTEIDIVQSADLVSEVPEPSAVVSLLGLSVLGIFFIKRK